MDNINFYRQIGKDDMYKTWHASKEHMLIYVYSEDGNIVFNEKVFPIKKGTLAFVAAGKYHYTMPKDAEKYERSKIFIAPEKLNKMLGIISPDNRFRVFLEDSFIYSVIPEEEQKDIDILFKQISEASDFDTYEMLLMSTVSKLLIFLNVYRVKSISSSKGIMNKVLDYINVHIFDDISIESICLSMHISKYYLCHQFKKWTNMTIMDYILKTRLVLAGSMLISENISVSEISERCHFSSVSYFCRVFKKEFGHSPLKYRKNHQVY